MPRSSSSSSDGPDGQALVIVESPAKARTIERFLGPGYVVKASIGHVRDLPERASDLPPSRRKHPYAALGVDVEQGFEPFYVVPASKKDQIKEIRRLLEESDSLWLATDEDREGEAISWHLKEVLKPKVPTHRLVFHEITRKAIQEALASPRTIDEDLVAAQETRRILDRLFGYEVSPVLWRKIRTGLSAGRVQSVALRLLVERERERMRFVKASYWDIDGKFRAQEGTGVAFDATLRTVGEKRVAAGRHFDAETGKVKRDDVLVLDEAAARDLAERLAKETARVASVEEKPYTQRPAPPFTTSTMQQEAGRKLRFSARRAMGVAQKLYENGVITYMRTDSTTLSDEAVRGARDFIRSSYGEKYLPEQPRRYKSKVKNAQEAHEAIRPAGSTFQSIDDVRRAHGKEAAALYELIWMRTVASQMADAKGRRVTVEVGVGDATFRASGKTITFPGFQRAYVEGSDDPRAELAEKERLLPPLEEGQVLEIAGLEPQGHETNPPARYTEASLVKELDQRGIGRPSTWASIISVLLDRTYAFRKSGALVPTFTGFAVVRMLRKTFADLLDYDFTARLEDDLDAVSRGEADGRDYLRAFYLGNGNPGLHDLVQSGLEEVDPREASRFPMGEHEGRTIEVRVGRYGLFVSDGENNASLPDDTVPDELTIEDAAALLSEAAKGPQELGEDPETGEPIYLRSGRFGPYVQRGDAGEKKEKPETSSLLPGMEPGDVDLGMALRLLSLPRDLGPHPDDGESVLALNGRYGPYVKWGKETRSLPEGVSPLEVTLAEAVEVLKQPRRRRGRSSSTVLKDLGKHPQTGAEIKILEGRYGPYVTDGDLNASVPKGREADSVEMEEALDLLARRAERVAKGGGRKKKAKRKTKKKAKRKSTKKAGKKKAKRKTKKKAAKKKAGRKAKKGASDGSSGTTE